MKKTLICVILILFSLLTIMLISGCSFCEHETEEDNAVAPTCTEEGLTKGEHCKLCGEILVPQEAVAAKGHSMIYIIAREATCEKAGITEGKKCVVCQEIEYGCEVIPALGHTTKVDVCDNCGRDFSNWKIDNYVDSFGDKTDKQYITTITLRNFKTDEDMYAAVLIDKESVAFEIINDMGSLGAWGYFNKISSARKITATIKYSDGRKETAYGTVRAGDTRLLFYSGYNRKSYNTMLNAFLSGEEIEIHFSDIDEIIEYNTAGVKRKYNQIS